MSEHRRNVALAVKVAEDGLPKYAIAAAARLNPSTFAGVLSGRVTPTLAVRARIASAVGADEHELFHDKAVSA